jgi:hypothetical protein
MKYAHAFKCQRDGECPENHGAYGCPCWIVMTWTSPVGEERTAGECIFQALPKMMVEVIKASNRPAAAIESTRNEIAKGFAALASLAMLEAPNELQALPDRPL